MLRVGATGTREHLIPAELDGDGRGSAAADHPFRGRESCPGDPFEFEVLEPRILLSASAPTPDLPQAVEDRPGWGERVDEGVFGDEESGPAGEAGDGFAYEAGEDDELFGTAEEDGENPVGGDDARGGPENEPAGVPARICAKRAWPQVTDLERSKDLGATCNPLAGADIVSKLTRSLHAANPPPGKREVEFSPSRGLFALSQPESSPAHELTQIVLYEGDRLQGTGDFPSVVNLAGVVAPGNSPGVMNVPTFTQGPEGTLEIEIGGTAPGQFDQFNVTGLAELDGTIELVLFGGFIPSAGDSFEVFTYGSRDGEFAHWLGTSGVPGNDDLAFVPVYDDVTGKLTLTVVSTTTVIPAIGATINSALGTLQNIGDQLDGLDEFAETLPLAGDTLGNIVDLGQGIQDVLVDQLNTFLAGTPTQAEVTAWIEGWEGTVGGAFTIDVLGVLGNYGASAYWWEVQFTATQVQLNQVLTDVAGAVLDAAFDPAPVVDIMGTLEFDFEFGYDTEAFVAIDDLTARATIAASGAGGIGFDFLPPGGPLDLNVTDWSVDFDASVSAVPDPGILTGGRITASTLSDIGGIINLADAFNLEEAGTVDASFTLDGVLSGFLFDYAGTHTVRIESDDLFDEATVDLTITIDGELEVLDQTVSGLFVLKKTPTETILEGSGISVDLEVGPARVLLAENGTGKFLLIDGDLAGTASLTITQGPDLPNLDISGTTLALALNSSPGPVTSIDGETVDLPAGTYYRVSGDAIVTLGIPDTAINGSFVFEPLDTDANPANGNEEIRISVTDLSIQFDDGIAAVLEVTSGNGAFVITDQGIAGKADAEVSLTVSGVDLFGTFEVLLNDTMSAQTVEVGGVMVMLAAGPFLRVSGEDAELDVLGLEVTGDFVFEQRDTDTGGETVVTLAASDVQLPMGTLTSDLITFENGAGLFLLTSAGVAGTASGDISVGVAEVGLSGSFELAINTTAAAVMETVDLGSGPQVLDLPAGPYVQVNGTGVALTLGPVSLNGDFSFEQRETTNGTQLVTVMADAVSFDFGTSVVGATNGTGLFLLTSSGMAGIGQIDIAVSAFGGSFVQPFTWNFNQTGQAIDDSVDWEGDLKEFLLPEGPYNRFSTGGPIGFSVNVGGQPQSMMGTLVVTLEEGPPEFVTVGVSEFEMTMSAGTLDCTGEGCTGAFAIFDTGIAGKVTAGTAGVTGAAGIGVTATDLAVVFNNTGADVGPLDVSVSDNPSDDVTLDFSGSEFHDFVALRGSAGIDAAGVVTLGGDFFIRSSGSVANTFEVGVQDLHFDVSAGSFTAVAFENGTGAFIINPDGVAGEATLDFEAGVVGLMGSAALMLNTTATSASGTVQLPDGSTQSFAGMAANSFSVCITDAQITVGPISVEIPGGIVVEVMGGNVEISRKSGGSLLATISSSGELTINDAAILADLSALADFAEIESGDFVGMLRTFLNWLSLFQDSAIFDINIPFTQNTTLGDALAWSDAMFEELYAFVVSIEVQSVTDFDDYIALNGGSVPAATATFDLEFGGFTYSGISVVIPAAVVSALGDNASPADLSTVVGRFNSAFNSYASEPGGAPELHEVLVARVNHSAGQFPRFSLALTEAAIADHGEFRILDPNADFSGLGFAEDPDTGDAGDVTQTAAPTSRYTNPEFIEALGDRVVSALGGNPAEMPDYDPATLLYAFPLNFSKTLDPLVVDFEFGEDLGPIGTAEGSGEITITPSLTFDLTIGFDLNAREVPRIISSSLIPVPANGRISEDAHFEILIGENPDTSTNWIPLTLPRTQTDTGADTNNSIEDLAVDFNELFAATPYGGSNLLDFVYAQKAGSGLAISVLDEDLDNDGVRDTVDEDANDNSVLDSGEDSDGDGNLDVVEQDWNGNLQLDDLTGVINLIAVRTLQDDVFATELGFGIEAHEVGPDAYFRSVAKSPVKGLFIEDANFSASVDIQTTDNITGSVNLGFLGISLDDPGLNGIATANPYTYDAGTDTDVFDPSGPAADPITISLSLVDAHTGESRLYLGELLDGLEVANIPDMVVGPGIDGSLFFGITDVSASIGSASLPTGVELFVWIPDVTELDYNPDPYHSQDNDKGIFLTYPDLGAFGNLEDVGFTDIIRALRLVSDAVSDLSAFSFLDERLPLIDISINDMLAWAGKLADLFDGLQGAGTQGSIQELITELEDQIELLFNLDPEDSDVFSITLDTSGIALSPVATGGTAGTAATATYAPDGKNNNLLFTSSLPGTDFNNSVIRVVGSNTINDSSAKAEWDAANKVLTIEINGGVTSANDIVMAVAAIPGTPWVVNPTGSDNDAGGNDGTGTYSTSALKFTLGYMTGYADSLPFMLDIKDLVAELGVTNAVVAEFLELATDLVSLESSGTLEVSAGATATLSFGLDLTNPGEVRPFLYDETGVSLEAKVLGTDITFEAALGGVLGIFIEDGEITLDRDGDPATGAADGDKGAEFRLGLRDNNGDARHYFHESFFDFDNIDLSLAGGVRAILPVFAPTMGAALGSEDDEDGDGFPDNALAIDLPDLQRLFSDTRAVNSVATIRMPGDNNDFTITGNPGVPDNFRVSVVEGGGAPGFSGDTLTIPVTSGVTSINALESAVEALGPFTVDDLAGNDGTGPASSSPLALAAPDFSALFENLDLCQLLFDSFPILLDGLDSLLGSIQSGLEGIVSNTSLPLVGNGLMGAADFISDFRNGLLGDLRMTLASAGSTQTALENAIKEAFWNSLGPGGLDILVDPGTGNTLDPSLGFSQLEVTIDCEEGLVVNLRLGKTLALVDTSANPIDFDIGIPGLGLSVEGNVIVAIGFDLKLRFGYNPEFGFFYDTTATGSDPELRLYFEATIPGLSATGQLAFLQLEVSDSDDSPSFFVGQFIVDIMDPDGDGNLTFAEITSPGTTFSDIVRADLEAVADVTLDLVGSFGGNAAFPRVLATFNLDWSWSVQKGASDPVVAFTDVFLDAGTFLSEFLAPVLGEIQKVTSPVQPLIDAVTARLPIFSDLAGKKVTLLTLAEGFGYLEPSTVRFIENVAQIITLINQLEGLGEGSLLIPFSAFRMSFDDDGSMRDPDPLGNLDDIDLEEALMSATGPDSGSSYQSASAGFASSAKSLDNFSIPLFDNPGQIINLFIGEPVGLVEWRMPTFRFEFEWIQSIAISPPLYAQLGGGAFAEINVGFGYDTFGIQKFIASEDRNPIDILDGFHVLDYDENGNERPEVVLGGEIFAGVEINLTVVKVGVRGGVFIEIGFDLHDVTPDGKVRPSDIYAAIQIDPTCLFDIHGEIGLFLEAFLEVDLFFFSIKKEWRFAEIILIEFDITCPEPVLASPESGGTITVHSGPNAAARQEIDTTDGNEVFVVAHVEGDVTGELIEVTWGNYVQQFTVTNGTVVLKGGSGDDYFDVRGLLSPVDIDGGTGNDTILLSDVMGSVVDGGDGNDTITVSPHENSSVLSGVILHGGEGNDLLTAGQAAIEIHGDGGNDLILGSPKEDMLFGDDGDDVIEAGAGPDHVEGGGGNDTIEGYTDDDFIDGGPGNDFIRGSRGDDELHGGDGDDELVGASGNDILIGGNGSDVLNGHGGIDLLIGDLGTFAGDVASIPSGGLTVTGLSGDGNDILIGGGNVDALFGVGGNDFLFGGNLYNKGDTGVIEEDQNDFFDGGPGDDTIFGDDAMGRTGDRFTGIAIQSGIFLDANLNGLRDAGEEGFAGVTVELWKIGLPDSLIATTETDSAGGFEFTGLDPNNYRLEFIPSGGYLPTTMNADPGAPGAKDSALDSDIDAVTGSSDPFNLSTDETLTTIAAGFTGTPEIVVSDVNVEEGDNGMTQLSFVVEFTLPAGSPTEVSYEIMDGSAFLATGDYDFVEGGGAVGTLFFEAFDTEKVVTVNILGDRTYEDHEQIILEVANPFAPGTVSAFGTILNDDRIPAISIRDSIPGKGETAAEDQTEADDAVFVIELSNPSEETVTVNYRTDAAYDVNALPVGTAATLFTEFPSMTDVTVTFLPGDLRREVVVPVSTLATNPDDSLDEPDESFYVDLYDAVNATIDDYRAVGVLVDDDEPVSVRITPTELVVTEGDSGLTPLTFTVSLDQPSGKTVTVSYGTSPGTARENDWAAGATPAGDSPVLDYIGLPDFGADRNTASNEELGVVVIEPGDTSATFTVEVRGDYDPEPDEFFFVNLLGAENAVIARTPATETNHATVLIKNDDSPGDPVEGDSDIRFSDTMYMIDEPEVDDSAFATITLERNTAIGQGIAVLTISQDSATAGDDYVAPSALHRQLVIFAPGELTRTIDLEVLGDVSGMEMVEGNEKVRLTLQRPTGQPMPVAPYDKSMLIIKDPLELEVLPPAGLTLEGTGGGPVVFATHVVAFEVRLKGGGAAPPGGVSFDFETLSITANGGTLAVAGTDFLHSGGMASIPGGSNSVFVLVNVVEDEKPELEEAFALRISNPDGAELAAADSAAIATIHDDDPVNVTGTVFYDRNGNGFQDVNEKGIDGVEVTVEYEAGGVMTSTTVTTGDGSPAGVYTAPIFLGPVRALVDGATVKSPYQSNDNLSPYHAAILSLLGEYETTTFNEVQSLQLESFIAGPDTFEPVGYDITTSASFPENTDDVGRGGTDDMIFGGPGDDTIDAGSGDDHVVGGHWMTATDWNVPVNTGSYDAVVTADTSNTLPLVYKNGDGSFGPIFSVDTSGLNLDGVVEGQIWIDENGDGIQGIIFPFNEPLLQLPVVVNLLDGAGNVVNSVVTDTGEYRFEDIYVEAAASTYVVEFLIPQGYEFTSHGVAFPAQNSDVFLGGRTTKFQISEAAPTASDIDAGVIPSEFLPNVNPGGYAFSRATYSVDQLAGTVEIVVLRGDSSEQEAIVYTLDDGTAAGGAGPPANYLDASGLIVFEVGETMQVVTVEVFDSGLGFCDFLDFTMTLREPTGRPLAEVSIYLFGGVEPITDDDFIDGGGDWDIILGDSGLIPSHAVPSDIWDPRNDPAKLGDLVYAGGPGKDVINGGNSLDFIDGQLEDDIIAGGEGRDTIEGGLGDDTVILEEDDDDVSDLYGRDRIISQRDVATTILTRDLGAGPDLLVHKRSDGVDVSTFTLYDDILGDPSFEIAQVTGGFQANTFNLTGWTGSVYLDGHFGDDTLVVENDLAQVLLSDSNLAGPQLALFVATYGYAKNASVSLDTGETYHLGGIENVVLIGGPGDNVIDAGTYTRTPVTFEGRGGDDTLVGGALGDFFVFDADNPLGTDTVTGNGGSDTLDFADTALPVDVDLAVLSPASHVVNANLDLVLGDLIENATGGMGADTLAGNILGNRLLGGPGSDTLEGRGGPETYAFGSDGTGETETVIEAAGGGNDVLDFSLMPVPVSVNLSITGSQTVTDNLTLVINDGLGGEGEIEFILGSAHHDTIRGNTFDNVIFGGDGDDTLDGKSGDDTLVGNAGNDDLDGGAGANDRFAAIGDTDFILTDAAHTKSDGETDTLHGFERAILVGGAGPNRFDLSGWTQDATINGADGLSPQIDTIVVAQDADFTLTDASLVIMPAGGGMSTVVLAGIDAAELTGGESGNMILALGFTGTTVLSGGLGGDTIRGGSDADVIDGGPGDDFVAGELGNDLIIGGGGMDTLIEDFSSAGGAVDVDIQTGRLAVTGAFTSDDLLVSIEVADLTGSPGNDFFDVSGWSAGGLTIAGGPGDDQVRTVGDRSYDPMVPGSEDDLITLTDTGITFAGAGSIGMSSVELARIQAGLGDDTLDASGFTLGLVVLEGQAGDDNLLGGQATNFLIGGDGDDRFRFVETGTLELTVVLGGDGTDTVDLSAFTVPVKVELWNNALQAVAVGELNIRINQVDVQNAIGGDADDLIQGNGDVNVLTGGPGSDNLDGFAGDDTIREEADAVTLTLTDASLDIDGTIDILANFTHAELTGGPSANAIDAAGFSGTATIRDGAGADNVKGSAGGTTFVAGADDDMFVGLGSDDTYQFDVDLPLGSDTVDDTGGTDLLDFSPTSGVAVKASLGAVGAAQTVDSANLELTLTAATRIENLTGGDQDDTLAGDTNTNIIRGGPGDDQIDGAGGIDGVAATRDRDMILTDTTLTLIDSDPLTPDEVDTLVDIQIGFLTGGDGANTLDASAFTLGPVALNGGAGNDLLTGTNANDLLLGGDGRDILRGRAGDDFLRGGLGDDDLTGGEGDDNLRGGLGSDVYRFNSVFDANSAAGFDTILEAPAEGVYDRILGLGLAGVDIDLHDMTLQIIGNVRITLIDGLGGAAEIEDAF